MSRVCSYCGKGTIFGINYSHSHRRSNRAWAPNLKKIKVVINGTHKTVNVCTRCMRSGFVKRHD